MDSKQQLKEKYEYWQRVMTAITSITPETYDESPIKMQETINHLANIVAKWRRKYEQKDTTKSK